MLFNRLPYKIIDEKESKLNLLQKHQNSLKYECEYFCSFTLTKTTKMEDKKPLSTPAQRRFSAKKGLRKPTSRRSPKRPEWL